MDYKYTNPWLSSGGTYGIGVSAPCFSLLDAGSPDAYAQAFVKHAQPEGTALAPIRALRTDWLNKPDMALEAWPHDLPADRRADGYVLAPNLFA